MARRDSLGSNLSTLSAGLLNHQVLNKGGDGTVVLAHQVRTGDSCVGSAGSRGVLSCPSVRAQGLGPLLTIGNIMEEQSIRIDSTDSTIGLLETVSDDKIYLQTIKG